MYNSIQQFLQNNVPNLEKRVEDFVQNPEALSDFITGVGNDVLELARNMIGEVLTDMNLALKDSRSRKLEWTVTRHERSSLTTSLGDIHYTKTWFRSRKTGRYCCLLDTVLGIDPHEKMTEDALARILQEAADGGYARSGKKVTVTGTSIVTAETVKKKLHSLEFPEEKAPEEKKKVANLYVSADEDHLSLQFREKKGDLQKDENGRKSNSFLGKLVYVYEDRELVSEGQTKRYELRGTHYFCGVYDGTDENRRLWQEVSDYIESHYEIADGGHIFITADGGAWIETAQDVLGARAVMVMDGFHLGKYLAKLERNLGDAGPDYRSEMKKALEACDSDRAAELFESMKEYMGSICSEEKRETEEKKLEQSRNYVMGNFSKITALKEYGEFLHGCSAEGHVSHVLSDRMSSRPMGWSRRGADRMSRLRAYSFNGKSMYELAKYQKHASEGNRESLEEIRFSAADLAESEKTAKNALEKYYDCFQASVEGRTAKMQAGIILGLRLN